MSLGRRAALFCHLLNSLASRRLPVNSLQAVVRVTRVSPRRRALSSGRPAPTPSASCKRRSPGMMLAADQDAACDTSEAPLSVELRTTMADIVRAMMSQTQTAEDSDSLLRGSVGLLNGLRSGANSMMQPAGEAGGDETGVDADSEQDTKRVKCADASASSPHDELVSAAQSAISSLERLIDHLASQSRSKYKSSGKIWKALKAVVGDSFGAADDTYERGAVALLAAAALLAVRGQSDSLKMIGSALISGENSRVFEGCPAARSLARSVLLALLGRYANGDAVCLQVVSKLASEFGPGRCGDGDEADEDLSLAVASVVNTSFGGRVDDLSDQLSKDTVAPLIVLASLVKPWDQIEADRVVRVACVMDLYYSAEALCDAAVESSSRGVGGNGASVARLATRALVDTSLEYRCYRRADSFAAKYYDHCGAERYAASRFLHAQDTIAKVVRQRALQIVDKQVLRVDEAVDKVTADLAGSNAKWNSNELRVLNEDDCVDLGDMSDSIRQYTLRKLRGSGQDDFAVRLSKIWKMEYHVNPQQLAREMEQRKITYLQWDDPGCPGYTEGDCQSLPAPELISEPAELTDKFRELIGGSDSLGFDCEFGEEAGIALLQLSTVKESLLVDVPALIKTAEGCESLERTVGKLFSGATHVKHVLGFGCKDDIRRLRTYSWFPEEHRLRFKDIRTLIVECDPDIGGKRGMHLGLSRSCEIYLGKKLDKNEQCSDWLARPLTIEQREYAALDAWACASIYHEMRQRKATK